MLWSTGMTALRSAFASAIGVALLTSATAASAAPDPVPDEQRGSTATEPVAVLVLPYQPILRSVPQAKVKQATEYLLKELKATEGLRVLQGGVATSQGAPASLEAAVKHKNQALEAETAKKIKQAIHHHREAIAAFEKNASALQDASVYIRTHHELARALMWSGADDDAKATIDVAARLDPSFELKPDQYSRLYRAWFFAAAQKVVRERPGALMVKSALPGATVQLDGRPMDVAPVLIDRVVPGKHLVTASVDGVPPFGIVVTVESRKRSELGLDFAGVLGGLEVGDVTDAVARNELPREAVAQAAQAGENARAEYVVAGGLANDRVGNDLNVHTFVVRVADRRVMSLNPVDFDSELLTAESDVIRVVRQVAAAIEEFSDASTSIAVIEKRTSGFARTTLNQVNGAPEPPSRRAAARRSTGPRKVFKALEGGTIRIQDEEE